MSKPNGSGTGRPITVQDLMQRIDGEIINVDTADAGVRREIDPEELEDLLEAAAADAAGRTQRTIYPIVCPVVINDRELVQSLAGQDFPASQLLLEQIELLHVAANRAQPIFILQPSSDDTWYGILAKGDGTQSACSTPRGSKAGDGSLAAMLKTCGNGMCIVAVAKGHWKSLASCLRLEGITPLLTNDKPATLPAGERSRASNKQRVYIPE